MTPSFVDEGMGGTVTFRVVRFSFTSGRRNDGGRYTVTDRTLAPATYRSPFQWRVDGYQAAHGNLSVMVLPDLTP